MMTTRASVRTTEPPSPVGQHHVGPAQPRQVVNHTVSAAASTRPCSSGCSGGAGPGGLDPGAFGDAAEAIRGPVEAAARRVIARVEVPRIDVPAVDADRR